jgi:hypothetical protein
VPRVAATCAARVPVRGPFLAPQAGPLVCLWPIAAPRGAPVPGFFPLAGFSRCGDGQPCESRCAFTRIHPR